MKFKFTFAGPLQLLKSWSNLRVNKLHVSFEKFLFKFCHIVFDLIWSLTMSMTSSFKTLRLSLFAGTKSSRVWHDNSSNRLKFFPSCSFNDKFIKLFIEITLYIIFFTGKNFLLHFLIEHIFIRTK